MFEDLKKVEPYNLDYIKDGLIVKDPNIKRFCKYHDKCRLFGGGLCPAPSSPNMPVRCYAYEGIDYAERNFKALADGIRPIFGR